MPILILGGTAEARAVAADLHARGYPVISSLAGRVRNPRLPVGEVRVGGFGGASGLADFLGAADIAAVVDATHPFAATMSAHAARACTDVPLLGLRRPAWTPQHGDTWLEVPTISAAAAAIAPFSSVFLTTGRQSAAAFSGNSQAHFYIRVVDEPDSALPLRHTLIRSRGPYDTSAEIELLRRHQIDVVVTKNSGGPLTVGKLHAARSLGIPVIMVQRPPAEPAVSYVESAEAAVGWVVGVVSSPPLG